MACNLIATTATRLPATKSRPAGARAAPAGSTEARVAVEGAQAAVGVLAGAQVASVAPVARTAAVGLAVARSVAVQSPVVARSAAEARVPRPAVVFRAGTSVLEERPRREGYLRLGAQYPVEVLEQLVAIRWQAEEVWVPQAGPEGQLASAARVATNREPAAREPAARAAAPMAAILVQADLRLAAEVRRPAVRAASATLPVHLGHCSLSDLSRRWLAFAGKDVVVVL